MVESMTGAARVQGRPGGVPITVFVRSVNHKYLDLALRLPGVLQSYEDRLAAPVRKRIARGRVDLEISGSLVHSKPRMDAAVLSEYRRIIKDLGGDPSRSDHWPALLRMPGVMTVDEKLPAGLKLDGLERLVDQAVERLLQARRKEGRKIEKLFRRWVKRIDSLAGKIKVRHGKSRGESLRRFRGEVARLQKAGAAGGKSRELDQVYLEWFEKFTITEELERITMHTQEIAALLDGQDPAGRQIEFYAQELQREINTVGSKARDFEIRKMVVELKTIVEDMKEQVRNLC